MSASLPKSIRQLLGVDAGGKVVFDQQADGRVTASRVDAEHKDPAIGTFLSLIEQDIQAGLRVQGLPNELARSMLEHAGHDVDLDEDIDGEVSLY